MHSRSEFPKLKSRALISPMAGITDVAFRALARSYGAGLAYTEFVSSTGLVRNNSGTIRQLQVDEIEKPSAVQLFGNNLSDVIDAAKLVSEDFGFDIIDINCGCPAWKVIKTGSGSEMLKDPTGIGKFVNNIASSVNTPVTVKIRKGIDENSVNAVEVAKIAEDNGAAAIAIHGRTQKQGYSGVADWDIIRKVKDAVNIPVIGNGDVTSPEIFEKRITESGADYILIARGAIGNPYIFKQINEFIKNGSYDNKDKISQYSQYLEFASKHDVAFNHLKTHAVSFTKGISGGARIRNELAQCKDIEDIKKVLGI